MTDPVITVDMRRVLGALARHPGDGWATPDQLLEQRALDGWTKARLGRCAVELHRAAYVSLIGSPRRYRITQRGRERLAATGHQAVANQPEQAADWAGNGFTAGGGEITIPCEFVALAAGERVTTIYDLPGTSPILALGITTTGRLLYGVRAGQGWAFEPQWVGICGARPSQLQDVLEQVTAELHVIDRQNYPSTLREHLRKQLRLQTAATLADLEAIFHSIPRGALIAELARMRDDGEIRFQGPRYIWTGKAS